MFKHSFVAVGILVAIAEVCTATAADLVQQIQQAARDGRATFVVPAGEHILPNGLVLDSVTGFTLRGEQGAVLRLSPVSYAVVAKDLPSGSTTIPVSRIQNVAKVLKLWIEAEGDLDTFTKKPKPYFLAEVVEVSANHIVVTRPLRHSIPAGTMIRDSDGPNLIELRNCSQIKIEQLTLDGGRTADDPVIHGHAQLCGLFASGRYSYEAGPSGPRPSGLEVRDCVIRNCFGRGIAWYSVENSIVERTTVEDCADEAIDLDHFSDGCRVTECRVARCRIGIEMNDVNRCTIEGNSFDRCETGLTLWRWCKQPGLNEENLVTRNKFTNCVGNGMQIGAGTARNRIVGNTIEKSGRNGISLHGEGQIVYDNQIVDFKMKAIAVNGGTHQFVP